MPDGATGSTVPRRQLGRRLRDLRGQARLTVRAAATALEWSEAKIWRIETGQTSMRSLDVEQMCRIYGAPTDTTASLMALAKETKARGWWLGYADVINDGFDIYIGLEGAASRLAWYESELVPGLFQTADYARTLIEADNPGVSAAEIDRRVQLRIARQALLTRVTAAPQLDVILNEAVLRRPVGGRHVMADQLDRIAELGDLPNVSIRIMPFTVEFHYGVMSGPFVMLEFTLNANNQHSGPPTVYVDSFTGALFLDKPHEIDQYNNAFKDIWTTALDEVDSNKMIIKAAQELRR